MRLRGIVMSASDGVFLPLSGVAARMSKGRRREWFWQKPRVKELKFQTLPVLYCLESTGNGLKPSAV